MKMVEEHRAGTGSTRRCNVLAAAAVAAVGLVPAPARAQHAADAPAVTGERIVIRGARIVDGGPLRGLDLSRDDLPANVQGADAAALRQSRALGLADFMNSQLQGVSVNDYAGNPFQLDVNYRGFTAGPQVGTPQGLSVFFDGVRVNEPFGDVVNWDLIPLNAIERFDLLPGSNPLYGLNTLGGALSVRSRSGFTAPGFEGDLSVGAWGRRQLQLAWGVQHDDLAGFIAWNHYRDRGWRDDSPSRVSQLFLRGDWRGEAVTITPSLLVADTHLVGNGLVPSELAAERWSSVYTSPDEGRNRMWQGTLALLWDLDDVWNLSAQVYHRRSDRDGRNGDIYEAFEDFDDRDVGRAPDGTLVPRNGGRREAGGVGAGWVDGTPIGLMTRTALRQSTDGLSLQLNANARRHVFMLGASIDRNRSAYRMAQRLGVIDAAHRVVVDPGRVDADYFAAANDVPGNNFEGVSSTRSLYASDTWRPDRAWSVTASARYNHTEVDNRLLVRSSAGLVDLHELRVFRGDVTDGQVFTTSTTKERFSFRSFNPSVGASWRPTEGLNLFGNVARGSRTPSVVELGCAFDGTRVPYVPGRPELGTTARSLVGPGCNLPTTLSGDPYLPQIRSTSGELGVRGRLGERWQWNASVYQTELKDDIYFVGVGDGRSYFDTIDRTRRRGFELGLSGSHGPIELKVGYSYTEATFESRFYMLNAHNSSADFNQNSRPATDSALYGLVTLPTDTADDNRGFGTYRMIRVDPGARMPGIPAHALNVNVRWQVDATWSIGLGMVARSMAYARGNENNLHQPGGTDQEVGQYYCQRSPDSCAADGFQQLPANPGRPFRNRGTVPGYAVFNLDTAWEPRPGTTVSLQVTNLFDRRYFTGARLGVNPFSPSVHGTVGPSGWNYNSNDWQHTTLVAPGAPRGVFLGLRIELGRG